VSPSLRGSLALKTDLQEKEIQTGCGEATDGESEAGLQTKKHSAKGRAALRYARRGWPVFPLFEAIDGRCACGNRNCEDKGKHPRTPHGFKDAATEEKIIIAWWNRWPDANVGIATGRQSGLLVLDVDPDNGEESLKKLLGGSDLPKTQKVCTGGGGFHL
jgi:hypothetical protein